MADPILSHDRVTADGADPRAWMYVLHGIYGAGRNWASVIRRIVRERPEWGALLIDLRQHGESQGFAQPHTIQAAAADLDRLAQHTGLEPAVVLGHSFGGKVALVHAGITPRPPKQVWVIDSTPEEREPDGSAWDMLELLESLPRRFDSRDELVSMMMERGQPKMLAQWMATNLVSDDGGYRWRFDFDSIRELLLSFFDTDAWDVVETPPEGTEIHLVKAEDSRILSGAALERAEAAAISGRTFVHRVAGGHWVNAENPAALESLLVQMLPSE
ncbi:MAG TPA: alpha/beta hydrolase [Longimicrobiales bacterium]|nr:alpha/beta hydrolase [Longimicrobiales bacterium]